MGMLMYSLLVTVSLLTYGIRTKLALEDQEDQRKLSFRNAKEGDKKATNNENVFYFDDQLQTNLLDKEGKSDDVTGTNSHNNIDVKVNNSTLKSPIFNSDKEGSMNFKPETSENS